MKINHQIIGLVLVGSLSLSLSISPKSLARFFYPPASIFSPTANVHRGSRIDPIQWLEDNEAKIFAFLLSIGNFESQLSESPTIITLFVPLDEAFTQLPIDIRERLSEPGAIEKLLKYHLFAGIISETDIENQQVITLEGNAVKITGKGLADGTVETKLNEATVKASIGLNDNLVLIVIDKVLLPPELKHQEETN